jgi:tRNA-(ms[2]io[6]A)-hydroxylase
MKGVILASASNDAWLKAVLEHFDSFLIDHAANERKASTMAMSLVTHYPDRELLVSAMIDLALEELNHFRQVVRLMQERNLTMTPDEKDPYVNQLRDHVRGGKDDYFLDRLLSGAVIEARGEERFRRVAQSLHDEKLKRFYSTLANSEAGHHQLFIDLAHEYFEEEEISGRLSEWIAIEDEVISQIPVRPRLH